MTQQEFQKRCKEVFICNEDDEFYNINVVNNEVTISMSEIGTKQEGFKIIYFDYKPDMTDRPQALDYLLGNREDFND